jgi:hypothetical protein
MAWDKDYTHGMFIDKQAISLGLMNFTTLSVCATTLGTSPLRYIAHKKVKLIDVLGVVQTTFTSYYVSSSTVGAYAEVVQYATSAPSTAVTIGTLYCSAATNEYKFAASDISFTETELAEGDVIKVVCAYVDATGFADLELVIQPLF